MLPSKSALSPSATHLLRPLLPNRSLLAQLHRQTNASSSCADHNISFAAKYNWTFVRCQSTCTSGIKGSGSLAEKHLEITKGKTVSNAITNVMNLQTLYLSCRGAKVDHSSSYPSKCQFGACMVRDARSSGASPKERWSADRRSLHDWKSYATHLQEIQFSPSTYQFLFGTIVPQ
jgi:hypothetical protein